ncbi:MAG: hypothetical protein DF168_00612 [Candidatus Moanabacter tarae]|uniref:Uncharacterized protein n=1 Tax=Candidatus Moanibacter tarae TaxID=2200854 RepID=A0A2Z4ABM9_9BACT|nr:MAG: hypothetical protein DF168_00612 [Candidatus Moanabacter tarae]|tara:strand:+ start:19593 stop:20099 length:507 start_codon:yes stop_codon:yes gene_type:complete
MLIRDWCAVANEKMKNLSKQSLKKFSQGGFVGCCLYIAGFAAADAQILPNAPLYDFRMPIFGQNGYILWDLLGSQGSFLGPDRIEIKNLTLRFFSGTSARTVTGAVKSPNAFIFPNERRASSGSSLHVTGHNFEISGDKWDWIGDDQTLLIKENVRMKIFGRMAKVLR